MKIKDLIQALSNWDGDMEVGIMATSDEISGAKVDKYIALQTLPLDSMDRIIAGEVPTFYPRVMVLR
jgi:hypothetical protein